MDRIVPKTTVLTSARSSNLILFRQYFSTSFPLRIFSNPYFWQIDQDFQRRFFFGKTQNQLNRQNPIKKISTKN